MRLVAKIIAIVVSSVLIIVGVTAVSVYMTRRTKNQSVLTAHPSNTTMASITDMNTNGGMSNDIDSTRETIVTSIDLSTRMNTESNAAISTRKNTSMGIANISSSTQIGRSVSTATSRLTSANMISNMTRDASTASAAMTTADFPVCATDFELVNWYTTEEYSGPLIITTGYFNNDNHVDLVVTNTYGQSVGVLLGNGNGTFSEQTMFLAESGTFPFALAVGDFNSDRRMDVVTTSYDSNSIVVFLGNGDGTLVAQTPISTGNFSSPTDAVAGYFNQDDILDIAVANSASNRVGIFIGNGNGAFQTQKTMTTGTNSVPMSIAAGDFNGDNYTDLAVANRGTNRVGVFLGIGNGSFRSQVTFSVSGAPVWINVADFNGDTYSDIAVLIKENDCVDILLGMGNGSFSRQTTYAVGDSAYTWTFTVGDVNQDKRWDIVVPSSAEDIISILLGRGDGTFANQRKVPNGEGGGPYSVVVADFNHDNRSDMAVACFDWDSIYILERMC